MCGEPLDSCGIYWARETPLEPKSDEADPGPPRGKNVDLRMQLANHSLDNEKKL